MDNSIKAVSVLLIEDNPGDRRLAEIALAEGSREASAHCLVRAAERLEQGLSLLQDPDFAPSAVLLDLNLPDASGLQGLNRLRDAIPDVPIIVLTGLSDMSTATEALKDGASDYLEKGEIGPKNLWRAIRYAIERKRAEAALILLANTDPLTGLLNRRALFKYLEAAREHMRRSDLCCAVIVFDVDGFKAVNDIHGHHVGDALLLEIGRAVSSCLRQTDAVGRLGGDEFAVIAQHLKAPNGAIDIAEKIIAAIDHITSIDGVEIEVGVSVGIAVFPIDDSATDILISHADMAMYRAKKTRHAISFYDDAMDKEVKARHALKKAMLGDISARQFYLEYQPIVGAQTGLIAGGEALARWHGPEGQAVSPGVFIPIAEESGWISQLGRHLLSDACQHLKGVLDDGAPIVPVSVNVSAIQCRDRNFGREFVEVIQSASIDPRMINVEITESMIIQNVATVIANLQFLKEAGVGVQIDDFGTGYSSLSVLKDLPLDVLKIDRCFVRDISEDTGAMQIVQAIAEMSQRLRLKTIAEGVETLEQAMLLREIGIDYLQGYYFSYPVDVDIFWRLVGVGAPLGVGARNEAEGLSRLQTAQQRRSN